MPIFEYQCGDCEREFEAFVTGDRKPACPSCHGENLSKLLSRPGMVSAASGGAHAAPVPACRAQGGRCGCH
jgi:putative FmdB family regulatory protein